MTRRLLSIFLLSALIPMLGATEPPAATTYPAPDRSSPEKTWASVCAALKAGDLNGFRKSFHNGNEVSQLFMDAFSDLAVSTFDLGKAAATLGDDGVKLGKKLEGTYADMVKAGENRKVEITGDTAVWTRRETSGKTTTEETFYFKLVKGEWLIDTIKTYHLDVADGREAAENMINDTPKVTAALKEITRDIRAKKITTIDQMRTRMKAASTK